MSTDIQRALGRVEGQLASIVKMLEENKIDHKAMEVRVASLESKVNWATGMGATLIAAYPFILNYLGLK